MQNEAPSQETITRLLQSHRSGDRESFNELIEIVYPYLRRVAQQQLRVQSTSDLGVTSLVNEAYLRLVDETGVDWQDRGHFYAIAALTMRRVLVDRARRKMAQKRGAGEVALTFDEAMRSTESPAELILAIDQALERLESFNPRLARVTECRYLAGMTPDETAQALHVSRRTVERDWLRARAWLAETLADS